MTLQVTRSKNFKKMISTEKLANHVCFMDLVTPVKPSFGRKAINCLLANRSKQTVLLGL